MSQDADDPAGKPAGRPAPSSTIAGLPPPRPGLPPPQRPGPQSVAQPPAQPVQPVQPAQPIQQYPAQPGAAQGAPWPSQSAPGYPVPPHQGPPGAPAYSGQGMHSPGDVPFAPAQPPPGPGGPAPDQRDAIPQAHVVAGDAGAKPRIGTESNPIQQIASVIEEVPGRFVGFLKISAKRAFRLRIEPTEVLPDERAALAGANPPVLDENLQAFLAWRRSVLFLIATLLVPLSAIGIIDSFTGTKVAPAVRHVKLMPALAETLFCLICWWQLRRWAHWRSQRKWLFAGWLLFIGTPFIVFAYPLKEAFVGLSRSMTIAQVQELGWNGVYNRAIAPFAFAMIAMFQLAPKVISLMPGLIRSSMVIKLLFPGSAAPGWLIVMSAPLYALIAYALLIIPYQFTGEPWFIIGIALIVFAMALVARSGFRLARPLSQDEAMGHIKRVRAFYLTLLVLGLLCIVGGLGVLAKVLSLKWTSIASTLLKFESNVLTLTIIGADLVVTNLDRARHYTEGKREIEEETEQKIAAFVGLNAPPTPPPAGPAPGS